MFENLATHCIKWLSFRIHNKTKHNNAVLTKTKNVIIVNNVVTRTDLIRNKQTKVEKASMSINVTADDEINLNKFKRKQNDRWHWRNMSTQNKYAKKMRKLNVYWYCSIHQITIYQDLETDLINKIWKVMKN